jgi:rubrerythrin
MEKEGKRFYLQSAEKSQSLLAKRIFEELAYEEDLHIKKIDEIYSKLRERKGFKDWVTSIGEPSKIKKVFEEFLIPKASASKGELDALRFALDLEDKSIKYYEGLATEAENPNEKRFYLTLSYEERGHYLMILDSIEFLTDPEGWFRLKEGEILEG